MKNVVFMVNIEYKDKPNRSKPYKYSIASWKKWCEKNDCELFVLNDLLLPNDEMGICWQRWYIFDLLEANGIKYDQIMYVDADTIPHPDCPNVFEMSERKFCFVHNDGSYDWVLRSIENYSKYFFNGYMFRYIFFVLQRSQRLVL